MVYLLVCSCFLLRKLAKVCTQCFGLMFLELYVSETLVTILLTSNQYSINQASTGWS